MWFEYLSNRPNVWRGIGSLKSKVSAYIPLKMFVPHSSKIWTKSDGPKYWKYTKFASQKQNKTKNKKQKQKQTNKEKKKERKHVF